MPECPHPLKKRETAPHFGRYRCKRCGADMTDPTRTFEVRHGPATTFRYGDRVRVRRTDLTPPYTARFAWSEETSRGTRYFLGELQTVDHQGKRYEDVAAWRWADPELVRHAPGLRDRRAREEISRKV